MRKIIITSILTTLCGTVLHGQQLHGDSLATDFRHLVKYLAQTHPDPYSAFGGKVFFHKEAFEVEQNLRRGATKEEFTLTAQAFMSKLGDGHTRIFATAEAVTSDLVLPLAAKATPDGMMAITVPATCKEQLGSMVVGVDGVSMEELAERLRKFAPVENIYGARHYLSAAIQSHRLMARLIPDVGESVDVKFENAAGKITEITLDYITPDDYAALPKTRQPAWNRVDRSEYMNYAFLDEGRRAMLFRMTRIMSREVFCAMRQNGMPGFEQQLENFYANTLRRKMPAVTDEAIAAIPSLAETFRAMLLEMKAVDAPYLIVDLRDNGGGWTPVTLATLYQLYGDRYLETDMGVKFYRMISPLYMQKLGTTLEDMNAARGTSYEYGDYVFDGGVADARTMGEKRREFVDGIFGGDPASVADLDGKPVYSPRKVFVITDEATFSAAFHYAFYLWKMGATVVGVPSSQAPNTFMEVTEFSLPYTGLKGSISNSAQMFLSAGDPRAKVFRPDITLSRDDYAEYGFDKYADLLYLMDHLKLKRE